jgi:hypothetical protein
MISYVKGTLHIFINAKIIQLVAGGNVSGITGEQVKGKAGYFIVKPVLMDGTYKLKEGDTVYCIFNLKTID